MHNDHFFPDQPEERIAPEHNQNEIHEQPVNGMKLINMNLLMLENLFTNGRIVINPVIPEDRTQKREGRVIFLRHHGFNII